jgi:hypothetical protein
MTRLDTIERRGSLNPYLGVGLGADKLFYQIVVRYQNIAVSRSLLLMYA